MRVYAFSSKIYVNQNFLLWKRINIFQELRSLSQDGNAIDHRLLVLLMANETKTVAWRQNLHWPGIEPGPPAWQLRSILYKKSPI